MIFFPTVRHVAGKLQVYLTRSLRSLKLTKAQRRAEGEKNYSFLCALVSFVRADSGVQNLSPVHLVRSVRAGYAVPNNSFSFDNWLGVWYKMRNCLSNRSGAALTSRRG